MKNSRLFEILDKRGISVSLKNIFDNSKADSGGERDLNFLKYLMENNLLSRDELVLKRTNIDFKEEYYDEKYKRMAMESNKHFYCRVIIQDELKKLGIDNVNGIDVGNMRILRSNSNYDIVAEDFSAIIDIGLVPARNYFRGLTDLRVKNYLITTYFDDYMDDIIFACFTRTNNEDYLNAVMDYQEGFKEYSRAPVEEHADIKYYDQSQSLQ